MERVVVRMGLSQSYFAKTRRDATVVMVNIRGRRNHLNRVLSSRVPQSVTLRSVLGSETFVGRSYRYVHHTGLLVRRRLSIWRPWNLASWHLFSSLVDEVECVNGSKFAQAARRYLICMRLTVEEVGLVNYQWVLVGLTVDDLRVWHLTVYLLQLGLRQLFAFVFLLILFWTLDWRLGRWVDTFVFADHNGESSSTSHHFDFLPLERQHWVGI